MHVHLSCVPVAPQLQHFFLERSGPEIRANTAAMGDPLPIQWPAPVWLAALRTNKGKRQSSWERLQHRFRVAARMGLQLPASCGFVCDLAKHVALSTEPDTYEESYDQILALAMVRPVLDGIAPLARLTAEQQFWQRYYLNIREQAMVRVSEVATLLQPCRLVEALELGDGNEIVWEGLGQTRVRRVQALSPLLLEQLGQARVQWRGSVHLASSLIREWTGVEDGGVALSIRCLSCNALVAHLTAKGLWRDISVLKPQPGQYSSSPSNLIQGVWPPRAARTWRRTQLCDVRDEAEHVLSAERLRRIADNIRDWAPDVLARGAVGNAWAGQNELVAQTRSVLESAVCYLDGLATTVEADGAPKQLRKYASEFLLQCWRVSVQIRREMKIEDALANSLAVALPKALQEAAAGYFKRQPMPTAATMSRFRLRLDSAFMKHLKAQHQVPPDVPSELFLPENLAGLFAALTVARVWWIDSSPQGGTDWLAISSLEANSDDLVQERA